ncbi:heme NO-binding domain-containing protein [Nafulsella turpanensis]|uniref:heme NO-binding domain-containing protein n=1 Tax=Nafulsella turpanensis TaxID=1265690 RepID=UPI00034CD09E|nr:heme NO-binding domain-containing protein [Nafulsella turpanensis]
MKGILFTELIELIEDLMGLEFTNRVIEDAGLENEGAFTAVGNYPYRELVKLLESLSNHAQNPKGVLLKGYGECLFHRLSPNYSVELSQFPDTFSLLSQLESIMKFEIYKLNPEASIPKVTAALRSPTLMEVHYVSEKRLSELVEGLIVGCINYFDEPIELQREDLSPDRKKVRFLLHKKVAYERN